MYTIKLRRDSSTRWARINPVLAAGEPALEIDTGRLKIGDGSSAWSELEYFYPGQNAGTLTPEDLTDHIWADEPHPVYDDGPSLVLLYENAKV